MLMLRCAALRHGCWLTCRQHHFLGPPHPPVLAHHLKAPCLGDPLLRQQGREGRYRAVTGLGANGREEGGGSDRGRAGLCMLPRDLTGAQKVVQLQSLSGRRVAFIVPSRCPAARRTAACQCSTASGGRRLTPLLSFVWQVPASISPGVHSSVRAASMLMSTTAQSSKTCTLG